MHIKDKPLAGHMKGDVYQAKNDERWSLRVVDTPIGREPVKLEWVQDKDWLGRGARPMMRSIGDALSGVKSIAAQKLPPKDKPLGWAPIHDPRRPALFTESRRSGIGADAASTKIEPEPQQSENLTARLDAAQRNLDASQAVTNEGTKVEGDGPPGGPPKTKTDTKTETNVSTATGAAAQNRLWNEAAKDLLTPQERFASGSGGRTRQAAGKGSIAKNTAMLERMRWEQEQQKKAQTATPTTEAVDTNQAAAGVQPANTANMANTANTTQTSANLSWMPSTMNQNPILSWGQRGQNQTLSWNKDTQNFLNLMDKVSQAAEATKPLTQGQKMAQGATKAAVGAVIKGMIAKIKEKEKGTEGADRSGGALTGGKNPWEQYYLGPIA